MAPDQPHHENALARLIRTRRIQLGLSQTRLASQVGRTATTIRRWERGEAKPPENLLPLLAEGLDVDVDVVVGAIGASEPHSTVVAGPVFEVHEPSVAPGEEVAAAAPEGVVAGPVFEVHEPSVAPGEEVAAAAPEGVVAGPVFEVHEPSVAPGEEVAAAAPEGVVAGPVFEIHEPSVAPGEEVAAAAPDVVAAQDPAPDPSRFDVGQPEPFAADADEDRVVHPWLAPVREPEQDVAGPETAGGAVDEVPVEPWIELPDDLPTEPLPPLIPEAGVPDLPGIEPPPPPAAAPPPVPSGAAVRPVAVIAPVSYVEDAKQRIRYAIRLIATLVFLAVGAVILVWAFGELFEATDAALDLFTDTTEITVAPGS